MTEKFYSLAVLSQPRGHAMGCGCMACVRERVRHDVEEDLVESMTDSVMACGGGLPKDVPEADAIEEALYARLTQRLMAVMQRTGMRPAQMHVVIDEFLAASRELAADAERYCAQQRAAERAEEERMATVEPRCIACQRQMDPIVVPAAMKEYALESYKCLGCQREGR